MFRQDTTYIKGFKHPGPDKFRIVAFQTIGNKINYMLDGLLGRTRSLGGSPVNQLLTESSLPAPVQSHRLRCLPNVCLILMVILYSIFGAIFFMSCENWSFLDSFYFVAMTFTTVGFGDYHVTHKAGQSEKCMKFHENYLAVTMAYIFVGLVLTGSTFNFLIVNFMVPKSQEITVWKTVWVE